MNVVWKCCVSVIIRFDSIQITNNYHLIHICIIEIKFLLFKITIGCFIFLKLDFFSSDFSQWVSWKCKQFYRDGAIGASISKSYPLATVCFSMHMHRWQLNECLWLKSFNLNIGWNVTVNRNTHNKYSNLINTWHIIIIRHIK